MRNENSSHDWERRSDDENYRKRNERNPRPRVRRNEEGSDGERRRFEKVERSSNNPYQKRERRYNSDERHSFNRDRKPFAPRTRGPLESEENPYEGKECITHVLIMATKIEVLMKAMLLRSLVVLVS